MSTQTTPQPPVGPATGYDVRPTSAAAVIGLIGGIVFWPVGLVASAVGISHTKPGRKKGRGLALAGLILSLIGAVASIAIIAVLANAASDPAVRQAVSSGVTAPALGDGAKDVTVTSCEVNSTLNTMISGTATIKNSQSTRQSYLLTVSANAADGSRVAELSGAASSIAPGQTATVQLEGSAATAPTGALTCVIAHVTRTGLGA